VIVKLPDPSDLVREAAVRTLGIIGSKASVAARDLLKALRDRSVIVRRAAAIAVREINPAGEELVLQLIESLNDDDLSVRQNAAGALGSYGWQAAKALEALEQRLNDPELRPWVDCAINRIVRNNVPAFYGTMVFRSAQPKLPDWPPPRPSTHQELSSNYLQGGITLNDAYRRLSSALSARDYDVEVLSAPGGFALVSRVERYDPTTGASLAEPGRRWSSIPAHLSWDFSLLTRFFAGETMYFRVFVFIVTDSSLRPIDRPKLDRDSFLTWVYARSHMLSASMQAQPISSKHCFVFVYNFVGKERQFILQSDSLSAVTQVRQSGISDGLEVYAARE
jgi:HEAT repeats